MKAMLNLDAARCVVPGLASFLVLCSTGFALSSPSI